MNFFVALASLALFVIGFRVAKILPIAMQAIERARGATLVLADRGKSDDEKEQAARDSAIALLGAFLMISGLTGLALVPSLACAALAVWAGVTGMQEVTDAMVSWPVIAAALLFFGIDYAIHR